MIIKYFLSLFLLIALSSCSRVPIIPDIGDLYNRSAQYHGPERNPVIVIPGILGSNLIDRASGKSIWGAWDGNFANPRRAKEARLIALPMDTPLHITELHDDIEPNGALDRVRLRILGMPIQLRTYAQLLLTLGVGGYRDEEVETGDVDYGEDHFTCFQFDYDWRLDNVANAKRLHEFILEKRQYVQEEYRKRYGMVDHDVKFNIVAHSMGGLIARYYLRYGTADLPENGSVPELTWDGTKYVDKFVAIGTPNAGSVQSFIDLNEGKHFGLFLPDYSSTILGTFPSIYQLLPRTRHGAVVDKEGNHIDIFDIENWRRYQWGIFNPDEDEELQKLLPDISTRNERVEIASLHLEKLLHHAAQFHRALDAPVEAPGAPSLLFLGDAMKTSAQVTVSSDGRLKLSEKAAGDGIVLRSSALLDERVGGVWSPTIKSPVKWSQVVFVFADHLELTKNAEFTDNVLHFLLES